MTTDLKKQLHAQRIVGSDCCKRFFNKRTRLCTKSMEEKGGGSENYSKIMEKIIKNYLNYIQNICITLTPELNNKGSWRILKDCSVTMLGELIFLFPYRYTTQTEDFSDDF